MPCPPLAGMIPIVGTFVVAIALVLVFLWLKALASGSRASNARILLVVGFLGGVVGIVLGSSHDEDMHHPGLLVTILASAMLLGGAILLAGAGRDPGDRTPPGA